MDLLTLLNWYYLSVINLYLMTICHQYLPVSDVYIKLYKLNVYFETHRLIEYYCILKMYYRIIIIQENLSLIN